MCYLELLCGRVQGVLHQVWVVTASLQQHENVLQLQVDVCVQRALDIQHWGGAAREERETDTEPQLGLFMPSTHGRLETTRTFKQRTRVTA